MSDAGTPEFLRLRAASWDRRADLPVYPVLMDVLRRHLAEVGVS